jgi:hypothetical protein
VPKVQVAPFTNPVPFSAIWRAWPGAPVVGATLASESVEELGLTVNVSVLEVPPPGEGVKTVTCAAAAARTSPDGMAARSWVELTKVVVRLAPFQRTTEEATKLVPVTVSVKPGLPAMTLLGDRVVSVGVGFPEDAVPVPVTPRLMVSPPAEKFTLEAKVPVVVGVKLTVPVGLAPAPRLMVAPDTTRNGPEDATAPARASVLVFWRVKVLVTEPPTATPPKSTVPVGVTEKSNLAVPLA